MIEKMIDKSVKSGCSLLLIYSKKYLPYLIKQIRDLGVSNVFFCQSFVYSADMN